jgi:Flp pilus assembly protein TadD
VSVTNQRLDKLQQLLLRDPKDTFLLYGVALEHKKLGDSTQALTFLNRVIEIDPGYCYAYHQKGLTYESLGDVAAAKEAYLAGIEAARKKGDAHAQSEIEAALSMIQ